MMSTVAHTTEVVCQPTPPNNIMKTGKWKGRYFSIGRLWEVLYHLFTCSPQSRYVGIKLEIDKITHSRIIPLFIISVYRKQLFRTLKIICDHSSSELVTAGPCGKH